MTSVTTCLNAGTSPTHTRSVSSPELQNHLPADLLATLTHKCFLNLSTCLYSPNPCPRKSPYFLSWNATLTSSFPHLPASSLISFPPILYSIARSKRKKIKLDHVLPLLKIFSGVLAFRIKYKLLYYGTGHRNLFSPHLLDTSLPLS